MDVPDGASGQPSQRHSKTNFCTTVCTARGYIVPFLFRLRTGSNRLKKMIESLYVQLVHLPKLPRTFATNVPIPNFYVRLRSQSCWLGITNRYSSHEASSFIHGCHTRLQQMGSCRHWRFLKSYHRRIPSSRTSAKQVDLFFKKESPDVSSLA